MRQTKTVLFGVGLVAIVTACAPAKAPEPIYAEPVFNKYGDPSCRPPTVPVGGAYTADLPLCPLISGGVAQPAMAPASDASGAPATVTTPPAVDPVDPVDPATGQPYRNRNTNQNTNQSGA